MQEIRFFAYETWCTVAIEERIDAQEILQTSRAIALRAEKMLNMYDNNSELSLLCKNYRPGTCCRVSPALFSFLKINLQMARLSGGNFDFTVGALVKRWNFGSGGEIPKKEELAALINRTGYQHMHLLPEESGVVFEHPGMILDPGGSGKGFAIDWVVHYLQKKEVERASLNFGGNLYVLGNEEWTIGIRSPHQPEQILCTIRAKNQAVSTSSCYEHHLEHDGQVYGHILNPREGNPAKTGLSSVTVLSTQAVYADILSTAVFLMGENKGKALINQAEKELGDKISCLVYRD